MEVEGPMTDGAGHAARKEEAKGGETAREGERVRDVTADAGNGATETGDGSTEAGDGATEAGEHPSRRAEEGGKKAGEEAQSRRPRAEGREGSEGEGAPPRADIAGLGHFLGAPPAIRSLALSGLFVLAVFYTLYFAKAFFLPIVLAALLNFLLSPAVRFLKGFRLPEPVGAAVTVIGFVGVAAFGLYRLSGPAAEWVEKAPQSLRRVEYKLRDVKRPVEQVAKATQEVQEAARVGGEEQRRTVAVQPSSWSDTVFSQTREVVAGTIVLLVLLYFLLASGDMFLRKLVRVMPGLEEKKRAVEIARQAERDISTYLATVTAINVTLGGLVALAMYLLEMPTPILWGVMAGFFNFIPYLGAIATIVVLAVVGLLTFESVGRALLAPGAFVLLNILEAYLITPVLLGRRLMLNTVAIFVSLIFWGWLWGIPGAVMAIPIVATVKIICDHVEPLRPVGEFLGR